MIESKKQILCIHYYYPPIRSGGVIRNYYFSRAFGHFFEHVHVVTTSNVEVMQQEQMEIPAHVSTYAVKTKDFRSIITKNNHIPESRKSSWIVRFVLKLKKTLPFHFWVGEGGPVYIRSAFNKAVELINKHEISHIYSSFMPYADHKIASRLKRKFPHLIWIADFRDLQVEPIYKNILIPKINLKIERQILKRANLLITVSEGLAKSLRKLHPKVLAVPRGIEPVSTIKESTEVFTISYTGNLYQHYRDGAFFVRALATFIHNNSLKFNDLQFVYAGRDSNVWKTWFQENNIEKHFVDRGFISRKESIKLQQNSNALLMLSSSSPEQQGVLTGKLFEYLESPVPIINVIQGSYDDEFEQLFKQLDAGKVFYTKSTNEVISYIDYLYQRFVQGNLWRPSEQGIRERKKWDWRTRAKQILDAV